jgi:hypothetical protein
MGFGSGHDEYVSDALCLLAAGLIVPPPHPLEMDAATYKLCVAQQIFK